MDSKMTAVLAGGLALLAWALASPGTDFIDLGGGLLMRSDGSVVGAWELPGRAVAADPLDAPPDITATATLLSSDAAWRLRVDRGW